MRLKGSLNGETRTATLLKYVCRDPILFKGRLAVVRFICHLDCLHGQYWKKEHLVHN